MACAYRKSGLLLVAAQETTSDADTGNPQRFPAVSAVSAVSALNAFHRSGFETVDFVPGSSKSHRMFLNLAAGLECRDRTAA